MQIEANHIVSIHYTVSSSDGTEIDSSRTGEPMVFMQGSHYLIKGLEDALEGKQKGDSFKIEVAPELAYGTRHEELVQAVPIAMFEGMEPQVGTTFRATTEDGEQSVMIIDVNDEEVIVDGNHPLSGIDLTFDVEVLDVREATKAELESGQIEAVKSNCSCC